MISRVVMTYGGSQRPHTGEDGWKGCANKHVSMRHGGLKADVGLTS
jgi:hypothetical protein